MCVRGVCVRGVCVRGVCVSVCVCVCVCVCLCVCEALPVVVESLRLGFYFDAAFQPVGAGATGRAA